MNNKFTLKEDISKVLATLENKSDLNNYIIGNDEIYKLFKYFLFSDMISSDFLDKIDMPNIKQFPESLQSFPENTIREYFNDVFNLDSFNSNNKSILNEEKELALAKIKNVLIKVKNNNIVKLKDCVDKLNKLYDLQLEKKLSSKLILINEDDNKYILNDSIAIIFDNPKFKTYISFYIFSKVFSKNLYYDNYFINNVINFYNDNTKITDYSDDISLLKYWYFFYLINSNLFNKNIDLSYFINNKKLINKINQILSEGKIEFKKNNKTKLQNNITELLKKGKKGGGKKDKLKAKSKDQKKPNINKENPLQKNINNDLNKIFIYGFKSLYDLLNDNLKNKYVKNYYKDTKCINSSGNNNESKCIKISNLDDFPNPFNNKEDKKVNKIYNEQLKLVREYQPYRYFNKNDFISQVSKKISIFDILSTYIEAGDLTNDIKKYVNNIFNVTIDTLIFFYLNKYQIYRIYLSIFNDIQNQLNINNNYNKNYIVNNNIKQKNNLLKNKNINYNKMLKILENEKKSLEFGPDYYNRIKVINQLIKEIEIKKLI